ncbi:hypothetical protein MRY82_06145 [bacterium]|nr:hypothetical protein [bacterium]
MIKIKYLCLGMFCVGMLIESSLFAQTGVQELRPSQEGWTFYSSSLTGEANTITWATRYNNNQFEMYEAYAPKLKNLSNCLDFVIKQNKPSDKEELYLKCREINGYDYILSLRNQRYHYATRDVDVVDAVDASETKTMSWQDKLHYNSFEQVAEQKNSKDSLRKVFKRAFVSPHYEKQYLNLYFIVDVDQNQETESLQSIMVSFAQYTKNEAGQLLDKPLMLSFIKAIPGSFEYSPSLLFSSENYVFQFLIDSAVVRPAGFTQKGFERKQDQLKSFVKSEIQQRNLDLSFIDDDEKYKLASAYRAALSQLYFDLNYAFFVKHWHEHRSNTLYSSVVDSELESVWIEFNRESFLVSKSTQRHMETMHRNNDQFRASATNYGIRPRADLKKLTGFTHAEMYAGLFWGDQYDQTSRATQAHNFLEGSGGNEFYWRKRDFDQTNYIRMVGLNNQDGSEQLRRFFKTILDE